MNVALFANLARRAGVAALLLATACDSGRSITGNSGPPMFAAGNGNVHSTTGSGVFDLSAVGAGTARFDFGAVRAANGEAQGTFSQYREADGLTIDFTGAVTCVTFDPVNHRAWVGGIILENRSTHPAFKVDTLHSPGLDVWFRVVDYGEGSGAPADRSTVFGFKWAAGFETSAAYCAAQPWPAGDARTWPVIEGNLQVRP